MKLRYQVAIILTAVVSLVVGFQPAAAVATANSTTPLVDVLQPTSSTYVRVGENISLTYNFKNVISRPYVTMNFKKSDGTRQSLDLNVATDFITIPPTWTPGTYRLDTVTIESITGAKGEHYRNHLYTGTDPEGNTFRCYTRLKLALMDIRIMKG